jgi:hypothetical protein
MCTKKTLDYLRTKELTFPGYILPFTTTKLILFFCQQWTSIPILDLVVFLTSITELSNSTLYVSFHKSSFCELTCCLKGDNTHDTSKFSSKWCSPHGALWSWNLTCQWCIQPGSDAPKDEGPHLHHCCYCHHHHHHEILTVQLPTELWKWINKFTLMMQAHS